MDAYNLGLTNIRTAQVCLGDTSTLLKSLNYQFFSTIQALFKITFIETQAGVQKLKLSSKKVKSKVLNFHIRRLIEILRLLDDHLYYGISEEAYHTAILDLRKTEQKIWQAGALNKLYQRHAPCKGNNHVIHMILGQIINHIDGRKRKFNLNLWPSRSRTISSALAELLYHVNNISPENDRKSSSQMLLNLLANRPEHLTAATKERFRSFTTQPRPGRYHPYVAFIAYALMHSDEESLKTLNSFMIPEDITSMNMIRYLKRTEANPELQQIIIQAAQGHSKESAYKAYIKRPDADARTIAAMLEEARKSQCLYTKTKVYAAYLWRPDTGAALINQILHQAQDFPESFKAWIYAAYLARTDTDPQIVEDILLEVEEFYQDQQTQIYTAYLWGVDTDDKVFSGILGELSYWTMISGIPIGLQKILDSFWKMPRF